MDPAVLARRILVDSGYLDTYPLGPRPDLDGILRARGVAWDRWPLPHGLPGALVLLGDEYRIVTNARDSPGRQRLSAAHELKHYLTDLNRRRRDPRMECAANVFARELLMPAEAVRILCRGFYVPVEVGRVLGVSPRTAGIRMAELGLGREQVWWEGA